VDVDGGDAAPRPVRGRVVRLVDNEIKGDSRVQKGGSLGRPTTRRRRARLPRCAISSRDVRPWWIQFR
jgi:hypothetical protein